MPIGFSCRCGEQFEVPLEMAGTELQCPQCKRLVDVPSISDVNNIEDDGTLKLDGTEPQTEPGRFHELREAFRRERVDDFGREIDLRRDVTGRLIGGGEEELIGLAGDVPLAAIPLPQAALERPKYDPVTGELIEELGVGPAVETPKLGADDMPLPSRGRQRFAGAGGATLIQETTAARQIDAARAALPAAAIVGKPATLHYANKGTVSGGGLVPDAAPVTSLPQIAVALLAPHNVFVMVTVMLFSMFNVAVFVPVMAGVIFAVAAPILVLAGQIGHIGNVIEDTGPLEKEELPTLFRDFGFGADLWWPFIRVTGAFLLSFGPGAILSGMAWRVAGNAGLDAVLALGTLAGVLFGFVVFPVVLLTLCTSGTQWDLMPWRLVGTARVLGSKYLVLVVLVGLATVLYFAQMTSIFATIFTAFGMGMKSRLLMTTIFLSVVLMTFNYVCHLTAWYMGLLYRQNVEKFPWVFQEHERDRREARLRKAPPAKKRPAYVDAAGRPLGG